MKEYQHLQKNDPRITPVDQIDIRKIDNFFKAWDMILTGEIR